MLCPRSDRFKANIIGLEILSFFGKHISDVDMDVNEPYSEGEETPDAFLVSLEALDENSWEFDLHLIDAITEVK